MESGDGGFAADPKSTEPVHTIIEQIPTDIGIELTCKHLTSVTRFSGERQVWCQTCAKPTILKRHREGGYSARPGRET